ncbi:uncharacterized protein M6B38_258465 [Iris pallida]|uniref:Uncharacterized protein n=1 Tax=Iris pallida TaxID=29817 RepID=A0AAX6IFK7_IRIPA|nr:uncharacterized protein M6B38_258465 [Iris pallida]
MWDAAPPPLFAASACDPTTAMHSPSAAERSLRRFPQANWTIVNAMVVSVSPAKDHRQVSRGFT